MDTGDFVWTINGEPMPIVQATTHMGIKRSAISNEATVEENIKKARKMLYSLMGSGLDGYNGLDPETAVHIKLMCYRLWSMNCKSYSQRRSIRICWRGLIKSY